MGMQVQEMVASITDNWWVITIKSGPRAGDVLAIGTWWPPPCENIEARMVDRDEALLILETMTIRAQSGDMPRGTFSIVPRRDVEDNQ